MHLWCTGHRCLFLEANGDAFQSIEDIVRVNLLWQFTDEGCSDREGEAGKARLCLIWLPGWHLTGPTQELEMKRAQWSWQVPSFKRFARSAPDIPGVCRAIADRSTPGARFLSFAGVRTLSCKDILSLLESAAPCRDSLAWTLRISVRPCTSGGST